MGNAKASNSGRARYRLSRILFNKMGHGIFTYFLLEKLQQSQGNATLGELAEYVTTKVKSQSLVKAGKRQVPSTAVSSTFKGDWKSLPVNLAK